MKGSVRFRPCDDPGEGAGGFEDEVEEMDEGGAGVVEVGAEEVWIEDDTAADVTEDGVTVFVTKTTTGSGVTATVTVVKTVVARGSS